MTEVHAPAATDDALAARVRELEAKLVAADTLSSQLVASLTKVTAERDRLRSAYALLLEQHELLRRRIFVAKAERLDATQLELEFAETKAKLEALAKQLETEPEGPPPPAAPPSNDEPKKPKQTPKGRRNLRDEDIPETRIELLDPELEGTAERIRFEESVRYGYRRGGPVRIVIARGIYKKAAAASETSETSGDEGPAVELVTASKPIELVERGLLAPSLIAHILVSKYRFGIPFHRLVEMFRAQGVRVDDGTMCRYAEDVGATLWMHRRRDGEGVQRERLLSFDGCHGHLHSA